MNKEYEQAIAQKETNTCSQMWKSLMPLEVFFKIPK